MNKPVEHEYTSHVAYTRALEEYCAALQDECDLHGSRLASLLFSDFLKPEVTRGMVQDLAEEYIDAIKQRDELLAAVKEVIDDAEECLDSDDWTAMLVSLDAFHSLSTAYDVIVSVKEGS